MSRFDGKVAIVTGGASGIGAATARQLSGDGAHVVVVDLAEDAGHATADEIGGTYVKLDVGDSSGWSTLVADTERNLGGVDFAFLNAGIAFGVYPVIVEDVSDEDYRRIMRVNVDGVMFGMRSVIPAMKARGGGAIVATSSLAGLGPHPDDPVYAATKHFVIGLVRSMARPLREHSITINAVCPGGVDTPIVGAGRSLMDASEIADAVTALLAGNETGHVYSVMHGRGAERFEFRAIPGMRG